MKKYSTKLKVYKGEDLSEFHLEGEEEEINPKNAMIVPTTCNGTG
jgi:hypothetical protein